MADRKIALVYFSATLVTQAYAEVMEATLQDHDCEVGVFNVTAHHARVEPLPIDAYNGVIFGFPVFADFAPSVINAWLTSLSGKGKQCATFFTYGGRTTGYAHFHTRSLLEDAGFQVLFSGEFLGRHSFNISGWKVLPDRPNDADFAVARDYIELALDRFYQEPPPTFHLQKPFGYQRAIANLADQPKKTTRGPAQPVRIEAVCSMCRDCETECPTQAFDADSGLSDPGTCIECMHCAYICPDEVIQVDPRMGAAYEDFLSFWQLTDDLLNAKRSKIITEAWQAAC